MKGCAPVELALTKSVSGWGWGDVLFGRLIGLAVDAATGVSTILASQLQATLAKPGAEIAPARNGVYAYLRHAPIRFGARSGNLSR